MENLELLDGIEISDGAYLWSGELLRTQFPQENHPQTTLIVTTNDGQSLGFDDLIDLAEEFELELDQDWNKEQSYLIIEALKIIQQNSCMKAFKKYDKENTETYIEAVCQDVKETSSEEDLVALAREYEALAAEQQIELTEVLTVLEEHRDFLKSTR